MRNAMLSEKWRQYKAWSDKQYFEFGVYWDDDPRVEFKASLSVVLMSIVSVVLASLVAWEIGKLMS